MIEFLKSLSFANLTAICTYFSLLLAMVSSIKVNYTTTNSSQIGNNFNYDGRFMNLKAYIFGKIQYGKMDTLLTPKTFLKSVQFFKNN